MDVSTISASNYSPLFKSAVLSIVFLSFSAPFITPVLNLFFVCEYEKHVLWGESSTHSAMEMCGYYISSAVTFIMVYDIIAISYYFKKTLHIVTVQLFLPRFLICYITIGLATLIRTLLAIGNLKRDEASMWYTLSPVIEIQIDNMVF